MLVKKLNENKNKLINPDKAKSTVLGGRNIRTAVKLIINGGTRDSIPRYCNCPQIKIESPG